MTHIRFIALCVAMASASALIACTTAPTMPMGGAMAPQMLSAKTPAERQAMMAEHMKAMQSGMGAMKGLAAMHDGKAMPPKMAEHHKTMAQHMEMMQMMMDMMAQLMPMPAAKP